MVCVKMVNTLLVPELLTSLSTVDLCHTVTTVERLGIRYWLNHLPSNRSHRVDHR